MARRSKQSAARDPQAIMGAVEWSRKSLHRVIASRDTKDFQVQKHADRSPVRFDPEYVRRHDVIYQRPVSDWVHGLPFGNGNIGGMVCLHDRLDIYLDRTDLWYDTAFIKSRDRRSSDARRGGRTHAAMLSLPLPRHPDILLPYEQRINLLHGSLDLRIGSMGMRVFQGRIYAHATSDQIVINIRHNDTYAPEPRLSILDQAAFLKNGRVALERNLGSQAYRVECRVEPASPSETVIRVVLVSRNTAGDDLAGAADDQLNLEVSEDTHVAWWEDYWTRSYLQLPDPYVENLWYLARYHQATCLRSATLTGPQGFWNHEEPVRPGGDVYRPDGPHPLGMEGILGSNHAELIGPFIECYRDLRPVLEEATARMHISGTASEPTAGHATPDWLLGLDNDEGFGLLLPAWYGPAWSGLDHPEYGLVSTLGRGRLFPLASAWIAETLAAYYEHTRDDAYLRHIAYPFYKGALRYLESCLRLDTDERLSLVGPDGANLPPFLVGAFARLLDAAIGAARTLETDESLAERWQRIRSGLAPVPTGPLDHYQVLPGNVGPPLPGDLAPSSGDAPEACLDAVTRYFVMPDQAASLTDLDGGTHPSATAVCLAAQAAACAGDGNRALQLLMNPGIRLLQAPQGLWIEEPSDDAQPPYSMTAPGGFSALVNALLVQRDVDGAIVVFPAMPETWPDATFIRQRLPGGLSVSAERRAGKCQWVQIVALRPGQVSLRNPFEGEVLRVEPDLPPRSLQPGRNGRFQEALDSGESLLLVDGDFDLAGAERRLSDVPATEPRVRNATELEDACPAAIVPAFPAYTGQQHPNGHLYIGLPSVRQTRRDPETQAFDRFARDAESDHWQRRARAALRGGYASIDGEPEEIARTLEYLTLDPEPAVAFTALHSLRRALARDPSQLSNRLTAISQDAPLDSVAKAAREAARSIKG